MKKLSLILILAPIFLITSLNFYAGEDDINHTEANRAFTCASCHPSFIDGIIIGKDEDYLSQGFIDIELIVPVEFSYTGVALNLNGPLGPTEYFVNDKYPYLNDIYGQLFILDINSNTKGKKENTIKIKYPISELDRENESIEIQGVISNLDGTASGDYSFFKKIDLNSIQKEVSVYPSISNSTVNIENLPTDALVQIYNTTGQLIYNKTVQTSKEIINVAEFQNGNYFVLVRNGKAVSQSKFIVSK